LLTVSRCSISSSSSWRQGLRMVSLVAPTAIDALDRALRTADDMNPHGFLAKLCHEGTSLHVVTALEIVEALLDGRLEISPLVGIHASPRVGHLRHLELDLSALRQIGTLIAHEAAVSHVPFTACIGLSLSRFSERQGAAHLRQARPRTRAWFCSIFEPMPVAPSASELSRRQRRRVLRARGVGHGHHGLQERRCE
jgi:hypothetical protein